MQKKFLVQKIKTFSTTKRPLVQKVLLIGRDRNPMKVINSLQVVISSVYTDGNLCSWLSLNEYVSYLN